MTTINNLDKAFESRVRLGIMSVLTGAGQSDFNTLKGMLGVSDGNLASHIRALEELGYIETHLTPPTPLPMLAEKHSALILKH